MWHLDALTTRRKWLTRGLRRAILKQFFRDCGQFQQIKLVSIDGESEAPATFSDNKCAVLLTGMLRLQREEPYVVVGDVRCVHLPGLLGGAPRARRAHFVCALHAARHQLDVEAASQHAARWKQQRGMLHSPRTYCTCLSPVPILFNFSTVNKRNVYW